MQTSRYIEELVETGKSNAEIAALTGLGRKIVKDRVRRIKQRKLMQGYRQMNEEQTATQVDADCWLSTLEEYDGKPKKIFHLSDMHLPFIDIRTFSIILQAIEMAKPDFIVVGSDAADFPGFSRFRQSPEVSGLISDELITFKECYKWAISKVCKASPDSTKVYIGGNHDNMLNRYLIDNSPKIRDFVLAEIENVIRHDGQVLYTGGTDRVLIDNLVVMHGENYNKHVAESNAKVFNFQRHVNTGHVHRFSRYSTPNGQYCRGITSTTNGTLSLRPHYNAHKDEMKGTHFLVTDGLNDVQHIPIQVSANYTAYFMDRWIRGYSMTDVPDVVRETNKIFGE